MAKNTASPVTNKDGSAGRSEGVPVAIVGPCRALIVAGILGHGMLAPIPGATIAALAASLPPEKTAILSGAEAMAALDEAAQARLLEAARQRGRLPVIIGLAVPSGGNRRQAIAQAQRRLLADLGVVADDNGNLSGPGISNVKLFGTIPFLALTAEPAALAHLFSHPLVDSIEEDQAVPPT